MVQIDADRFPHSELGSEGSELGLATPSPPRHLEYWQAGLRLS